ncbi:MAG: muconolactone Delta-isomerase family protein [Candidatus Bathyarchaeia archaeon]|jgi:muconolactone delta-isomerase
MSYLVTGEFIENSVPPEAFPQVWETVIRPSLESLAKMGDDKKLTGGIFAGQRAGAFVIEVQSNEELDTTLGSLPFWGLIKWNVTPLQTIRGAIERDRKAVERMKASKR